MPAPLARENECRLIKGTIIAESIRAGASLDAIPLTVRKIRRGGPASLAAEQEAAGIPSRWTLIEFEIRDDQAAALADSLAEVLDDTGWYVDFHSAAETFVVFAGRVFRYPRGDKNGRAEAESHARSRGVPDAQLDWPE
jgi:hypothetical protein